MKKQVILVALCAMMAMLAVSCQKESVIETLSSVAENGTVYTVQYIVHNSDELLSDPEINTVTIHNEAEEQAFMQYILVLSREGKEVSFFDEEAGQYLMNAKDTEVHTTRSEADATDWSIQKVREGCKVTVGYDQSNGQYTCVATK